MKSQAVQQLLHKTQTLSRHEAAHYVTAFALGFHSEGISLLIELDAHRGKSYTSGTARCESLTELQCFIRNRILIILAGAMGEALDPVTYKVDAEAAYNFLDGGLTGAALDFAVARELINLLHNSLPLTINPKTGGGNTTRELLIELMAESLELVTLNSHSICKLAKALEVRVVAGKGNGNLETTEIDSLSLCNSLDRG